MLPFSCIMNAAYVLAAIACASSAACGALPFSHATTRATYSSSTFTRPRPWTLTWQKEAGSSAVRVTPSSRGPSSISPHPTAPTRTLLVSSDVANSDSLFMRLDIVRLPRNE